MRDVHEIVIPDHQPHAVGGERLDNGFDLFSRNAGDGRDFGNGGAPSHLAIFGVAIHQPLEQHLCDPPA